MRTYEVRLRKDHRSVDLISEALPFGRLRSQLISACQALNFIVQSVLVRPSNGSRHRAKKTKHQLPFFVPFILCSLAISSFAGMIYGAAQLVQHPEQDTLNKVGFLVFLCPFFILLVKVLRALRRNA
jgi:hypothetical protein